MNIIKQSLVNPNTMFNLNGIEYQKGNWGVYYRNVTKKPDKTVDYDNIQIGIRELNSHANIIATPSKVTEWSNGTTPYNNLNTLLSDLSALVGFNYGRGGGVDTMQQVATYNDLVPGTEIGDLAYVEQSQGTAWLPGTLGGTYYPQGFYLWSGSEWISDRNAIANQLEQSIIDISSKLSKNISDYSDAVVPTVGTEHTIIHDGATFKKVTINDLINKFINKITFNLGVLFTPQVAPTYERGRVYFDDANDCISFMDSISGTSVQVGYEVLMRARNNTGATILNGSVVYISGAIGQNSTVALAQANTLPTSEIIGIATHDIANNTVGKICVFGLVNDLNTSSFTDGQMLYLSATAAGGLTSTIPASPNFVVALGVVEHAHPTQGKILVRSQRALANNNALGTAQNVPPTQNAVKQYVDSLVQPELYKNWHSIVARKEAAGFLVTNANSANYAASGTVSVVTAPGTNRRTTFWFTNWLSAATAGALAGIRQQNSSETSLRSGYESYFIFGNNDTNSNAQSIIGFTSLIADFPNVDFSAYTGSFHGIGNEVGDTNLSFIVRTAADAPNGVVSSYTKIPLGSNFPAHNTTDVYLAKIETPQTEVRANQFIKMTITNLINGATETHTFESSLCPFLSSNVCFKFQRSARNSGIATNIALLKYLFKSNHY